MADPSSCVIPLPLMRGTLHVICLLAAMAHADEAEIRARTKWGEARVALEKKDGKAALAAFEDALKGLPSDPLLLYEAARCALDIGDLDRAERWISAAVRTDDAAFKAKPEYQEAFALAARVRAAREAAVETAEYAEPIKVIEEAIRRVRSKESMIVYLSNTFETIHLPVPKGATYTKHPLKEKFAVPRMFSGWSRSCGTEPEGNCRFVLDRIATEKAAAAVFDRILKTAEKELPVWERLAALKDMEPRVVRGDDATVPWDDEREDWSRRRRSVAYAMKWTIEDMFGEISAEEVTLFAISLYEVAPKDRETTFRVVVRMQAGFE